MTDLFTLAREGAAMECLRIVSDDEECEIVTIEHGTWAGHTDPCFKVAALTCGAYDEGTCGAQGFGETLEEAIVNMAEHWAGFAEPC